MFRDTMFNVKEQQVYVINPLWNELGGNGQPKFIAINNKKAIVNHRDEVLSVVSKDYCPITDNQVLQRFLDVFNEARIDIRPVKHHITVSKDGVHGRTTYMEVELPAYTLFKDTDEEQKMRVVIPNSYDGTLKLKALVMLWRKICSNGMMGWKPEFDFGIKHRQGGLERLTEVLNLYLQGQIESVGNMVEKLSNLHGTSDRIIAYLENNKIITGERGAEKMMGEWLIANNPTSFWGLYNCFTHYITHSYGRNYGAKLAKYDILNKEVGTTWNRVLRANDNYEIAQIL